MLLSLIVKFTIYRKPVVSMSNKSPVLAGSERSAASQQIERLEQAGFSCAVAAEEVVALRVELKLDRS